MLFSPAWNYRRHDRGGRSGHHDLVWKRTDWPAPQQDGHGVPILWPIAASNRIRKYCFPIGNARPRPPHSPQTRFRGDKIGGPRRTRRLFPPRIVWRTTTACRHSPVAGHWTRYLVPWWTVFRAWSMDPSRNAGWVPASTRYVGQNHRLYYPWFWRSPAPGRPDCNYERWGCGTMWHARPNRAEPSHRICAQIYRRDW